MKARSRRTQVGLSVAIGWLLAALAVPSGAVALDLPPAQPGRYVYDLADVLSPATIARAQAIVAAIKDRTGAEIAVVSWPTGEDEVSPEDALTDGRTIMDTWGVGRKGVDDGLVVLFDMDDSLSYGGKHGQATLVTGSGFRDLYLSDGEAKSIVDEDMVPLAEQGDLDGALIAALGRIDADVVPGGNPAHAQMATLLLEVGAIAGTAGLVLLVVFLSTWWRRGRDGAIPVIDDSVLLPAPPPGLTPALATVLRKDAVDRDAFTTALIDLGHRGLIVFRQTAKDPRKVDFVVPAEPSQDAAALDARRRPLGDAETALINAVRAKAQAGPIQRRGRVAPAAPSEDGADVLSSDRLRTGAGASLYIAFRKGLGQAAKASPWFRDDPTRLTRLWRGIGIAALVGAGVGAWLGATEDGVDGTPSLRLHGEPVAIGFGLVAIAALVVVLFSRYLAARTAEGGQVLGMTLAYRNTLRRVIANAPEIEAAVASAQPRLPWIGTPDELAVWATALGLRAEIDELFKHSLSGPTRSTYGWSPGWVVGGVGSVANFDSVTGSIATTSVSSSGGGYGGGGGGGGGGASGGF